VIDDTVVDRVFGGDEAYTTAVQQVVDYVTTRVEEVQSFLADQQ
jgi:hypothetical protein